MLEEAVPIILQIALELNINLVFEQDGLGSFLSTRRSLVTTCVLNSDFFFSSLHNVLIYDYDNIAVLWISSGSSTTLLTLLMQPTDHKDTMIIYITRKFKLLFFFCLLTSLSLSLDLGYVNPFKPRRVI